MDAYFQNKQPSSQLNNLCPSCGISEGNIEQESIRIFVCESCGKRIFQHGKLVQGYYCFFFDSYCNLCSKPFVVDKNYITGYRLDDNAPEIGEVKYGFRNFSDFLLYLNDLPTEGYPTVRYWKIYGTLVKDEGGIDGLTIKVQVYHQILLQKKKPV